MGKFSQKNGKIHSENGENLARKMGGIFRKMGKFIPKIGEINPKNRESLSRKMGEI